MKKIFIFLIFSLACTNAFAQGIEVRGTIRDSKGLGSPGVSVNIEGTKNGTVSNVNGQYAIKVPNANSVLVFSSVGSVTVKEQVKSRTEINIEMVDDATTLSEVQVVGYGVQKKASVVGAISNVEMKELRQAAPSNLSNALSGRVPGLIARMGDGAAGGVQSRYQSGTIDDAQIFIRGKGTFGNTAALILIDGVEGSLSRLNPEDIDQISVLKDASATAIYGVRGANGVILVTTKKGVKGKPKFTFGSQVRIVKPLDFPEFLGSYDYATLYNEAQKNVYSEGVRNGTIDPTKTALTQKYTAADIEHYRTGDDPYFHSDVNWEKTINKDHYVEQQHIASVSGGTDKVTYYISSEYNQSGGIVKSADYNAFNYRRYNLRSNLEFQITKTTKLGVNLNGLINDQTTPLTAESSGQRIIGAAWYYIVTHLPMDGQVYNPNGSYNFGLNQNSTWNINANLLDGGYNRRTGNTLSSTFNLTQTLDFITPGLAARVLYGNNYTSYATKQFNKFINLYNYHQDGTYTLDLGAAFPFFSAVAPTNALTPFGRNQQLEGAITYNKIIEKDHAVSAMVVGTQTTNEVDASIPANFGGVAGRVTYAYKNKYLFEGNVGYNGSDKFNSDHRYALFPAGAVGWVISEEKFVKDNVKFLDFLKIRGDYGEVGNDKLGNGLAYYYAYSFNAPPAQSTSTADPAQYSLGVNGVTQTGLQEGTLPNALVTWEVAKKADLGLDVKMFNSRLSFTADLFLEKRSGILAKKADAPLFTALVPAKLPASNIGKVTNKGIELSLGYADRIGDFSFNVDGNVTYAHNTIDYQAEALQNYPWLYQTGHSIGTEKLYTWTRKFYSIEDMTNPKVPKLNGVMAGDLMFADLNGDGVIDPNDMSYQGYTEAPEIVFGWNVNVGYKNFNLSTNWYGASHVSYRTGGAIFNEFGLQVQQFQKDGRWVYDPSQGLDTRATATYPVLVLGGSTSVKAASTFTKLDASYIRLRSAEFSYTFSKKLIQKLGLTSLRVFVSASNLLTFSPMKKYHLDPEYVGSDNPNALGTVGTTGVYSPGNKFYATGLYVTF
jgi:TonB-linked SusC/RagA family outer membrane protein